MLERCVITLALILAIFLLPWWLSLLLVAGAIIRFPSYIEGCLIAGLFDVVYAETPLFGIPGFVTFAMVLFYLLATYILIPRLRHDVFA